MPSSEPEPATATAATPVTSLRDCVRSFYYSRSATEKSSYFTRVGRFDHVSEKEYKHFESTHFSLDILKHARIDYFGDRHLLIEQRFWWPEWGNISEKVLMSGSMDIEWTYRGKLEKFQADGGLKIPKFEWPFLVIEVADTQAYSDVWEKVRRLLLHSKGQIRFAIIIKLECKTKDDMMAKMAFHEPDQGEQDESHRPEADLNSTSKNAKTAPYPHPNSSKVPEPTPSPNLPTNTTNIYSRGYVTVLGTEVKDATDPTGNPKKVRILRSLLNEVEFWPTAPSATFNFKWDDLPVRQYPSELVGRTFTLRFDKLHRLLAEFFNDAVTEREECCVDGDEFMSLSDMEKVDSQAGEETNSQADEETDSQAVSGESTSGRVESDSDWVSERQRF
ncbi:hypothetical protein RUND412_011259 [Rhizina undulata]